MSNLSIGTTYWSRRLGTLLWAEFDRGAVRDELQQLAAVGVDTLRLPLVWEDFQPRPERITTRTLRLLEQLLDLAGDARLRALPELMPLAIAGAIHLPAWTTAESYAADMMLSTKFGPLVIVRNEQRPPLVWERTMHKSEVRDLWSNPGMRAGQRKLIEEVVGYFGDHPGISGWEVGSGLELARAPSSSDAAGDWLGETADVVRQAGGRGALYYAASLRSLRRREGPRPEVMVDARITPLISLLPLDPPFAGQPVSPELLRFVVALVRSLCGQPPALVVGQPAVANGANTTIADQAYGRQVQQALVDHDAHARLVETALPELALAGVPAFFFAHAFTYGQPFPPERAHSVAERMMGLFDTDGEELPVALAVQRFKAQPAPAAEAPFVALDVESYWSDPSANFRRLWQQAQADPEDERGSER